MQLLFQLTLLSVFAPLLGSLLAGLYGKRLGVRGAHSVTIALMVVSMAAASVVAKWVLVDGLQLNQNLYHWAVSGEVEFNVGFMIDRLSAVLMLLVTFVSTVVHLYSVGYMAGDAGNQRFFSYVSLFTFAMLLLVSANNFFQLFVGWEGVGLVSYLLIGFWYEKESAAAGSLKAFLVNRVGDFGFLLGIAGVLQYFGSLDYQTVFANAPAAVDQVVSISANIQWPAITTVCILLFIGAMGKSAQMPLHVWLPESMEGPTPISALIHAATMVTAGVFMVARLSPLFEWSNTALSVVLIVGATGALLTGLLAFVEFDIKRVIAYSTMSQLGYMMAADGASAYSTGIFHLLTHGCFKALLFLAAGSVIVAMHHEQDLRHMGNLKRYLPWTCVCFLIGALSLSGIPPFAGFFSKDSIIEAVHASSLPGAGYAYTCLLVGAFVTAFYIFRAYFMAFHTEERMSAAVREHLHEPTWFIRLPLVLLAIPSVVLGVCLVNGFVLASPGILGDSITVLPVHQAVMQTLQSAFVGAWSMVLDAWASPAVWFAVAGVFAAWWLVVAMPQIRARLVMTMPRLHAVLVKQYGFDALNDWLFVRGFRGLSKFFYQNADLKLIDHWMVDGSGRGVSRLSRLMRRMQSGYLYHYAFAMIIGLLLFLFWLLVR